MLIHEIEEKMKELLQILETLPAGTISVKQVGDKQYFYNRYYDKGHRREKYIRKEFIDDFIDKMKYKKVVQEEYEKLRLMLKKAKEERKKK